MPRQSPPKVAIWSLFRDNEGDYIADYWKRVNSLDYGKTKLRFYLVEGDSIDGTFDQLRAIDDQRVTVVKQDTGLPRYGNVVHPQRFECLAKTGNAVIDAIVEDDWADYALMLESDIIFKPDLLRRLIGCDVDMIAPMVWVDEGAVNRFYDTWAFRRYDPVHTFPPFPSTWYLSQYPSELFECYSVGSVALIKMDVLRAGVHYTPDKVVVGLCDMAHQAGFNVYCDPTTHVRHP